MFPGQCRRFVVIALMLVMTGCSATRESGPEPTGIEIDGVIFRNELAFPVTDVQILVPSSGNFVGCGTILGDSECSTTFPNREYQANQVIISWKEYGKPHSTGPFVIQVPENIDREAVLRLEVIIFNMGQAGARLIQ